jgi:hypothetical protein
MAGKPIIDPDELRQLLAYDGMTGKLFWLERNRDRRGDGIFNAKFAGKEALVCLNAYGYPSGTILGRTYTAHRVVWALVHGEWPALQIDHINGDRSDNRLCNLRHVSGLENDRNKRMPRRNRSGVIGVSRFRDKWQARINAGGRIVALGTFASFDDAVAARSAAEKEYGYHPNHGRS